MFLGKSFRRILPNPEMVFKSIFVGLGSTVGYVLIHQNLDPKQTVFFFVVIFTVSIVLQLISLGVVSLIKVILSRL